MFYTRNHIKCHERYIGKVVNLGVYMRNKGSVDKEDVIIIAIDHKHPDCYLILRQNGETEYRNCYYLFENNKEKISK